MYFLRNLPLLASLATYAAAAVAVKSQTSSTTSSVRSSATSSIRSSTTSSVRSSNTSSVRSSTSSSSARASTTSSSARASTTSSAASASTTLTPDDADTECSNTPSSRACWGGGFSIATDFDKKWPDTGKTVPYTLTITNTTADFDGTGERMVMLINNQYPGPVIRANWGDWLEVTVNNHLPDNGTGIHWHGVRQYETCDQDGVPGITECPIAPGTSRTYRFHCTQYGTSWYHSHWSVQYGVGTLGTLVIDGPATDNYDEDLGPFAVTDWYTETAFFNNPLARSIPPQAYTGLVNGMNVSPDGTKGKYFNATVQPGKRYRLRLINTSVDSAYMVSVDNHPFTVISNDFVPVMPYVADRVFIGIGQRLDVIIEANQTAGNYWFRADVPGVVGAVGPACGNNANPNGIRAIIHYSNSNFGNPTSTAWDRTGVNADRCTDESYQSDKLTPYWDSFVPSNPLLANPELLSVQAQEAGVRTDGATIFSWAINTTALNVTWEKPILEYVQEGNTSYPHSENLINVPDVDWTYWVLQEIPTSVNGAHLDIPHPIHLHGHDFYVLGAKESSNYTNDQASELNFKNPPRRDTAMLPAGGWLVLAFETNNPGAWIMHCHIAWHVADGLATQFLETPNQIKLDPSFNEICSTWRDYYPSESYWKKDDSGV